MYLQGKRGAAECGAVPGSTGPQIVATDPDIWHVIEAWPTLPGDVRAAILELVDAAQNATPVVSNKI
jgi:hypothetical protein